MMRVKIFSVIILFFSTILLAKEVVIKGKVRDENGNPVAYADIVVFPKENFLNFIVSLPSKIRGYEKPKLKGILFSRTDKNGKFELSLEVERWRSNYIIEAGFFARKEGKDMFYSLGRSVVKRLHKKVIAYSEIVIHNRKFFDDFKRFVAELDSSKEKEIYNKYGIPERIDRYFVGKKSEVVWWYFSQGKAFRFRDGELIKVEEFDPVIR